MLQGSILGPILFALYMISPPYLYRWHPNIPTNKSWCEFLIDVLACVNDIKGWMGEKFLQLNENKTEVILFGFPQF